MPPPQYPASVSISTPLPRSSRYDPTSSSPHYPPCCLHPQCYFPPNPHPSKIIPGPFPTSLSHTCTRSSSSDLPSGSTWCWGCRPLSATVNLYRPPARLFPTDFRTILVWPPLTAYPTSRRLIYLPALPMRLVVLRSRGLGGVLVKDGDPLDYLEISVNYFGFYRLYPSTPTPLSLS